MSGVSSSLGDGVPAPVFPRWGSQKVQVGGISALPRRGRGSASFRGRGRGRRFFGDAVGPEAEAAASSGLYGRGEGFFSKKGFLGRLREIPRAG